MKLLVRRADRRREEPGRHLGPDEFNQSNLATLPAPWLVGAGSGGFFNGAIADVAIHRRELSAEEIHAAAAEG